MGVLGAFFGCSGDGGFNGCCSGACSGDGGFMLACISGCRGVIGFNVATSQLPVREKVRPACSKWPKMSVLWRAGRTFSRVSTRGSVAGRTFSRVSTRGPVAGRTFSRVIPRGPAVGRTCSRVKWGRGCTGPILSAYRHRDRSSPVEWCNRFVSFGVGYALSWSGGSSCPVGWGVSRDLVRMSRLR